MVTPGLEPHQLVLSIVCLYTTYKWLWFFTLKLNAGGLYITSLQGVKLFKIHLFLLLLYIFNLKEPL